MRITITYDQFGQDAEIEFDNYTDAYDFVSTMPCGDVEVAGSAYAGVYTPAEFISFYNELFCDAE